MITIEFQDAEKYIQKIKENKKHWSNIFEFEAVITFDYGTNGICQFETLHHFMTIDAMTEGIIDLLLKGEQSSYGGYGASYNKRLVFKVEDDHISIEIHPRKGNNILAKTTPNVLALDYIRALKEHKKVLTSFQKDDNGQEEIDLLDQFILEVTNALKKVS